MLKYAVLVALTFCLGCDAGTEPPLPVGNTPVCLPTCDNPLGAAIPGQCSAVVMACDEATGIITSNVTAGAVCDWGCYPQTATSLPKCRCVYEGCDAAGNVTAPQVDHCP